MKIDEILNEINSLSDEYKQKILAELRKVSEEKYNSQIRENVNAKRKDVGKCYCEDKRPKNGMFPKMKKYYKIISERSNNDNYVSALIFYEHPLYWFDYKSSAIGRPGDYFLGNFDFYGFYVDDIWNRTLNTMEEITNDEYNTAARKHTDELLGLNWSADHYRFGGKLPTDQDWEISK